MKHYRYQAKVTYHECFPASVKIDLLEFDSVKETKGGYWIIKTSLLEYYNQSKSFAKPIFVLKQSRKRYAYPSKEEAFNSFKIRNIFRISYLTRDLDNAEIINRHILEMSDENK